MAQLGALGTISSVDLRHHHPDLLAQSKDGADKAGLDHINLIALDHEIKSALALARGSGAIAVNVMKAVGAHLAYVRQACESGAHAIVMDAGLPFELSEMTRDFPDIALIPILPDARGVNIVLRKWLHDGIAGIGQFCIDTRLELALKGDIKKGLFFRSSESLPFGAAIHPVADLPDYLLTGRMPAISAAA